MDEDMKRELNGVKKAVADLTKTVGDLAKAVHDGFARVDQRFEQVDRRFEQVDRRFGKADDRFDSLEGIARRTAIQVAKLTGDVSDIKVTIATKMATKDDLSLIHTRLDAFLPEIEASRRERALHSDAYMLHQNRLNQHERRLSRLESERA
jgi:chromosome segregation ATPase